MRVFLRFNGLSAGTAPPPVFIAGPFIEDVAQDNVDVPDCESFGDSRSRKTHR
ncbi:hypothetical protein [Streptomyces griseoviridis]|uniref:Uncharacterized protein n=1 Tax=Streptomyces griseoviridis TaxID=45398 RepID=A0ABT9LM51_STRGD|nr:hypothetical protein [Streptomyces griseoviridis]